MSENLIDLIYTSLADLELAKVTQGNVKNCTIFRSVDVFSSEHLVAELFYFRLTNKVEEGSEDGLGEQVFGEIEQEGDRRVIGGDIFPAELLESFRIFVEEILENEAVAVGVIEVLKPLPSSVV